MLLGLAVLTVCILLLIPSAAKREQTRMVMYIFDQMDREHLRYQIEDDPEFQALTEQEKSRFLDEAVKTLW